MTREEAIRELKADYCGNRIICELYPDQCNREDCEIWLAITALQAQDKLQDIEYMCRLSGGADYFNAFRAISEKVKNTTTFLNNLNDGVENSTATQSNGIESKVKGMTACRVPDAPTDTISRQAAIDIFDDYNVSVENGDLEAYSRDRKRLCDLPPAQPEPISDAYMKAVWTWLLNYQIKAAELKGRYTPYEVLSWVANDWRKEHE